MTDFLASAEMAAGSFHEAAHAVAAIELGMREITVRIIRDRSISGVQIDADISFACPTLGNEPLWRTLQRRLTVMLAGPEWELFSAVQSNRKRVLREQRADRIAIVGVIRQLRNQCVMHGRTLRNCIEDAWNEAAHIRILRNGQLVTIALALDASGALSDSELRALFAQETGPS
jgi:hypothetical protein